MNPIPSNPHESFPLLSNQHARSRFVRNLENIADLGLDSGLKMLSIRHTGNRFARALENIAPLDNVGWVKNVVDSTRFDRIDTNRTN